MLYERHSAAARALARQYVPAADAEDVVADAFSKLFEMLRRGVGPDAGFRPYLYTMVRHRSFDVSRGAARTRPSTDDEIESVLGRVASKDDPTLQGFERSVIAKAYVDLPERWREVLWYVLVDELKPAQVAPVLGLSPNGVSALLYRAKEALRAGYLQQHLTHAPSDTCRTVNPLLGGYVRASLSKRETIKIDEHLSTCATCSALVLELHDVAHGMKTVIAPLVLGAGGLALVGAGAPIGGMVVAGKAGAGAAAGGAHSASAMSAASSGSFSGAVSSAVSTTAGAVASAAAAATGGSVAAGALAVAAVGLVAALQITAPPEADPLIDTVIATNDARELPGGGPAEGVKGGEPVLPTDVVPNENTAYIEVDYADAAQPLTPRQNQNLWFTVENTGAADATGTQVEVTLPDGLAAAKPEGSFGTGIGGRLVAGTVRPAASATPTPEATPTPGAAGDTSSGSKADASAGSSTSEIEMPTSPSASPSTPATEGSVPVEAPVGCAPTERANVVLCSIGELAQGATRSVVVPVQANAGGDYPVSAKVWADGLQPMNADLPSRTVAAFGPELSAQTRDVSLSSPGSAPLPVTLVSTGDRTVGPGWAVEVSLPDGVKPASEQAQLSCGAGDLPNSWLCTPVSGSYLSSAQIEPNGAVDLSLNVTTAASSTAQPAELGVANVRPVLAGSARSASATLVATSAWANAGAGVGTVTASCLAEGGVDKADAAVIGSYTNTTQRVVRVALEAAGSREATGKDVAPGESARVTVHDGLRVPAGQATFVLTTDVDGNAYETRVAAGDHRSVDCYQPAWDTETSVQTANSGGTVGVVGTITNKSSESVLAVMSVPVGGDTLKSVKVPVAAGGSMDLSVNTDRTHMPAGDVTFHLSREVADSDGDLADAVSTPANNPTRSFAAAQIQPAAGEQTMAAEPCVFDAEQDRSVQTFQVTADNTASTLPVPFHVGDVTRTVPAGQTEVIEFPVVWGTGTVALTAAGQTLDQLDVAFKSCADVTWPTAEQLTVETAAECVDQNVQIAATVQNGTGREWRGVLVQDATGATSEEQVVPAGSTTFVLPHQPLFTLDGNVTVRLTRELEGTSFTVEKSFAVKGENCVLPEPTCEPTADPSAEPAALTTRTLNRAPTDSPWRRLMGLDRHGCEPADSEAEQA
ncbi:sigma-70 family RNA polymerase sigma factor [Promicromonospora sp. NPDC090134]|uniref:sigma-70 family RNA polymerase sigma factor n=1 Tax=Promicromonospora sp. NPDC090134 TaxID=3364408 RepID=UPI00381B2A4C